jgi:uncharacterized protein (TIGR00369 family)
MYLLPDTVDEPLLAGTLSRGAPSAAIRTALQAPGTRPGFGPVEANKLLREKMAPWIQELQLSVEACSSAGATLRLPRSERLLRPGDTMCGPVLMACADTAMVIAIMGRLGELRNAATVNLSIDFMRPMLPRDVILGATVRNQGRSLIFTECSFVDSRTQAICVHATATWALLPVLAASRGEP